MGLADLGGDHVQDPPPQDPQRLRVMVAGLGEQVVQRLVPGRVVDQVVRQRVDRIDDHRRLVGQHVSGRERGPDRCVGFEPAGQLRPPVCLGAGQLGGVRPPVRRARRAPVEADLDGLGVPGHPHRQLRDLGTEPGELVQRRTGLRGAHRPQRRVRNRVHLAAQGRHRGRDAVPRIESHDAF